MMYKIATASKNVEKRLRKYIEIRGDIPGKLDRLRNNPRSELGAHQLYGRLAGKWSCWLGSNIRMIYIIEDLNKKIIVQAVGTHKIY